MAELGFDGSAKDTSFAKALDTVLGMGKKDYPDYIGGLKIASGMITDVHSPIDSTIIFGSYQQPEKGLADRAVEVAKGAHGAWNRKAADDRIAIFSKILDNIKQQRSRLAAMVSLSAGLTERCAMDEVDILIDVIADACNDAKKKKKRSMGVWAILTSYNSPLAAPMGYAAACMLAGNTVVLIPSVHSIMPVCAVYDMLVEAGLPDGVLNIIFDGDVNISKELTENLDISGIVAAGLGKRMEDLMFSPIDDELGFINEIKGMNPVIVYKPQNMHNAAKWILHAAFGQGMSVSACSKVIVTKDEEEKLINALLAEAANIKVNDPSDPDATMGPMISKKRRDEYLALIDSVRPFVIFGGDVVSDELTDNGYYVRPAIVTGLDEEHDLNIMDSAFPILTIQTVDSIDDAIENAECTEHGISAGLMSRDENAVRRFKEGVDAEFLYSSDTPGRPFTASKARVDNFTA